MERIVFTGAPSTGKTTVINELNDLGFWIVPEVAQKLLDNDNINIAPGTHKHLWQSVVEHRQILNYREHLDWSDEYMFYDRSFVGEIGWRDLRWMDIPKYLSQAARNLRFDHIFLFPFVDEIYDYNILSSIHEAIEVEDYITIAYDDLGYQLTTVPFKSPAKRVKFILSELNIPLF